MPDEFRYDVAISFLSAHEELALRLADELKDRLAVFVYSREQPEVIGRNTDGVNAFTNVFRFESRVCVIIHSEGWGRAGYTFIEEAALKERALDRAGNGWDFLLVVCVDSAVPPKWIPSTKIWYGFKKYGLDGLLATIDNRVTELGGRPEPDSLLAKAARRQRERDFAEERALFAKSTAGYRAVTEEVQRLPQLLRNRVATLLTASPSLDLTVSTSDSPYRSVAVSGSFGSFVLYWQPVYSNSLTEAVLLINEWGGRFSYSGGPYGGPPKLDSMYAGPTIDYARQIVWQVEDVSRPLNTEDLLDFLLSRLVDRVP